MMSLLKLNKVDAAPWGEFLLQGIDLELAAGEVMGVIGPNGAGKTSLLKLMSGDISPTNGRCDFLGRCLSDWEGLPRARVLAVLPQLSLLNFPYSVEEVILLGRTPHSSGHKNDLEILREVMRATDTLGLRDRIYTQLSGGEKQRVQLARVFAQVWREEGSPRLLLLDEPTAALDLAHQQLILESVRILAGSGCGVVMVAHDFNLVAAVAQKIVAISGGRVVASGTPEAVLTRELFENVFEVKVSLVAHPESAYPLVVHL
jgi:iron complex transport system ATP-binding protein